LIKIECVHLRKKPLYHKAVSDSRNGEDEKVSGYQDPEDTGLEDDTYKF